MGNSSQHKNSSTVGEIERVTPYTLPWYSKRLFREHEMRYAFVQKYVQGKIVLDIACGNGYGSVFLATSGAKQVYGIDNDISTVAFAKKHYTHKKVSFLCGDAENLNIKDGSIDVVVSFETIEHLPHPKRFVREVKRVLHSGGLAIISTPNKVFSHGDNPFHLKEFTYQELEQLFWGFKSVEFYGQRPVYKSMFVFLQFLEKHLPFASKLFRFRPWEPILIRPIKNKYKTDFLYFIAVCKTTI